MPDSKRKIVNDPVYGFITIDNPLIFDIIQHPYFQRLRRIHQMALASLVYPGAMHTRFHHSLGAYHLMGLAIRELKGKNVKIEPAEEAGAKIAILLHDIGHGPFSHALENSLVEDLSHEDLSCLMMERINFEMGGKLDLAIKIFKGQYRKKFLHQLVSGQLDVDRMDYLNRDSFYTGVIEGVIGYDRIIKMLTVHKGELMVEEKGIYSIEKFIVARRLMYWQVYLHKTVLSAESILVKILKRAKDLSLNQTTLFASPALKFFMNNKITGNDFKINKDILPQFCKLDDFDILSAIKVWVDHPDRILSLLCRWLINRNLFKTELSFHPYKPDKIIRLKRFWEEKLGFSGKDLDYFVFTGTASNYTYNLNDEKINILFKSRKVRDISGLENALINNTLSIPIKKFYICYPRQDLLKYR
ncbi:MAG TPA: HD domain-containing protein [Chitinophagaceae bacterium]|nr:HD domain-containing protein [Chitinophagaceae bacterium]